MNLLLSFLAFSSCTLVCNQIPTFQPQAVLPESMKTALDAHVSSLLKVENRAPVNFKWLPDYIIKYAEADFDRLRGATYMQGAIDHLREEDASCPLFIPAKYPYTTPDGHNHFVIAHKVPRGKGEFAWKHINALKKFIMITGWDDCIESNIMLTTGDKVAIIDTEPVFEPAPKNPKELELFGLRKIVALMTTWDLYDYTMYHTLKKQLSSYSSNL